jgi:5-methylcytosine-specific restriction enzyme A
MPTRSPHFCLHPGCRTLTVDAYCMEHAPLHQYTDNRENATARGYDNRWRALRDRYISTHPLCERCDMAGKTVMADVVHHIRPIDEGGPRLDARNLMALCRDCHEEIHGRKREG